MPYPWKPGAIMLIRNVAWPPGVMMPEEKGVGAPETKKVSVHFPALPTVPKGSAAVLEMAIPVSKPFVLVRNGNKRFVPSGGSLGQVRLTPAPAGPRGPGGPVGPAGPGGPTRPGGARGPRTPRAAG